MTHDSRNSSRKCTVYFNNLQRVSDWHTRLLEALKDLEKAGLKYIREQLLEYTCIDGTAESRYHFIKNNIIHRFGIPRTITTHQGAVFTSVKLKVFLAQYDIRLVHSSPYYPQANGQADANNKTLIAIIKKALEDNLRAWTILWRKPCRFIGMQSPPRSEDWTLLQELDSLMEEQLQALEHLRLQKKKAKRTFQSQVRSWSFHEGDLVWKTILSEVPKDPMLGKWSPKWKGPFIVSAKSASGAYKLMESEGEKLKTFISKKHLKALYP
ncbi:uncharacterized protein LOC127241634 [Andrographis paniculata]|uniref:uncharacterized protein LOC127241634 n=1 Tax=Andrographis paniculata TaxID=175694 RepID=UPI0021E7B1EF|nr:uncharacterized protein LOC127241634 [Andrographis paniculata]